MAENILAQQVRKAIDTESLFEFINDNLQGENLSLRGVAALCGVEHTSIIRSGAYNAAALAEKLGSKGFEPGALIESGFNPVATWLTIQYFANESKAKATFAKAIRDTFGAFGVKSAFNQASDLKFNTAIQPVQDSEKVESFVSAGEALGRMFGPAYGESFTLLNIKKHCPSIALPEVSPKERASMETAHALLNATQVAEALGITCKNSAKPSPQNANKLLANLGYQYKVGSGKDAYWTPTEKGEAFCDRKPVSTNSKSDKFQLLWRASIINELRSHGVQEAA